MSITSNLPSRPARQGQNARRAVDPAYRGMEWHATPNEADKPGENNQDPQNASSSVLNHSKSESNGNSQGTNGNLSEHHDEPPILRLSNEMLLMILDHIIADPEKTITVDNRLYLSRESFSFPVPPPPEQEHAVGSFRRVCRRFSELGAARQYARVTTRFSRKGFKRLEEIAGQEHLARCVRKFSYMVPYFYTSDNDRLGEVLPSLNGNAVDVNHYLTRVQEQRSIINDKEDLRVLKKALLAFTELQHVQILPVQDQQDQALLSYIRGREDIGRLVELKWAPACAHSTRTIGEALIAAHSKCSRFSTPIMNPRSAMTLADNPPGLGSGLSHDLEDLAERLTCLELHFDGELDLDTTMRELSPLFRAVFSAARNMQAVHVGFPSYRPVSLPIEAVFHYVRWEKLLAFGIQGWKLHTEEIIGVASRHRDRLKGLRLRDVQLKEGSMWKDVLAFLRNDMRRLDWVSLRRIGYARTFEEYMSQQGMEILDDDPPFDSSEEDDEWDMPDDFEIHTGAIGAAAGPSQPHPHTHIHNGHHHHNSPYDSDDDSIGSGTTDDARSHDDEHGPDAHVLGFPASTLNSPDTPTSGPFCNCGERERNGGKANTGPENPDDLGDNGVFVNPDVRRMWERWVVRRCPEHSPR